MFSLELPHHGDSKEYTQYSGTIFNIIKKTTLNYPKSAAMGFFLRDSRTSHDSYGKQVEAALVNKPSVFEPLKVYCRSRISEMFWEGKNRTSYIQI